LPFRQENILKLEGDSSLTVVFGLYPIPSCCQYNPIWYSCIFLLYI